MPTFDYIEVTAAPKQIPGLAAGTRYVCQNTTRTDTVVRFCNSATDPSADPDIGWFLVHPGDYFTISSYDASDPVWVATNTGKPGRITVTIAG